MQDAVVREGDGGGARQCWPGGNLPRESDLGFGGRLPREQRADRPCGRDVKALHVAIVSSTIRAVRLVLASASPRRRELLATAGITFDVDAVDVDERQLAGEAAPAYVDRLARLKASTGASRHPDRVVLGADTAVVVDDVVFGKPSDDADARRMLRLLQGRAHEVLTGVAVAWRGRLRSRVECTSVWMASQTDEEIAAYVATGEPAGKAGAYAIQGLGSRFIPRIAGSYANVVGLPVAAVLEILREMGLADCGIGDRGGCFASRAAVF